MTPAAWTIAAIASAVVMLLGSRVAIRHAVAVAWILKLPTFLVGMTLVAIGTDIPEMVSSIVAAYAGHGDVALGDTIGSVFTQITFGLGLFPFFATAAIVVAPRNARLLSGLTVVTIAIGAFLYRDAWVSRTDALVLIGLWLLATVLAWRLRVPAPAVAGTVRAPQRSLATHMVSALLALAVVGVAASVLVKAITVVSAAAGIQEYALSFFGAAVATSLPELAVEITALRRGERDIALGDVLGSCLVDASLAFAVGPLLFPIAVTTAIAQRGAAIAAFGVLVAGVVISTRGRLDRRTGALLLFIYVAAYLFLAAPPDHGLMAN